MSADPGLHGRVAAVTGGSAGIGAATAAALAAAGARVAIGARDRSRLEATAERIAADGHPVWAHPLDVADPDSVEGFFAALERTLGPVEVLVANAGIARPAPLADAPVASVVETVAVNLTGALLCVRRALPALGRAVPPGDLVLVTSDAAVHPRAHLVAYTAAKAGLEAAARALALELEGSGVRVCALRVGPTLTGFADGWDPDATATAMRTWQAQGTQRHWATLEAEQVASVVVDTLRRPRTVGSVLVEVQPVP